MLSFRFAILHLSSADCLLMICLVEQQCQFLVLTHLSMTILN